MPRRLLAVLLMLTCLPLLVPTVEAQPRRPYGRRGFTRGIELSLSFVHNDFERKVDLDDEFGAGFRFGYLFTPRHQLDFLFNGVTTDDSVFPGIDVDVINVQIAYVYNFTHSDIVPYVTGGFGFVHTDDSDLGTETDPVFSLGGGVRLFVGPVLHVRFEVRANRFEGDGPVYVNGEDVSFSEFSFGVGWRFPTR